MRLLERIRFDPRSDRLWLVGDLVNRGPRSLDVLRWARGLDESIIVVLGNHDLHLLMRAAGLAKKKKLDTLDRIFEASDCDALVDWLRHRPLLHREDDRVMVHAGLHPSWSTAAAASLAGEVEAILRADDWKSGIEALRGKSPPAWRDDLAGQERLQAIASIMLRIRVCTPDGVPEHRFSGPPWEAPKGYVPWFSIADARWREPGVRVVFGHWAALGLHLDPVCMGLDTGCVWGGALTAVRLEDQRVVRVPVVEPADERP